MRYKLRTLLIVLALGPILIWAVWLVWLAIAMDAARMLIGGEVQPASPQEVATTAAEVPDVGKDAAREPPTLKDP